jgi:hypothetical protein
MDPLYEHKMMMSRRHFFGLGATGIGTAALASLMAPDAFGGAASTFVPGEMKLHFAPKAKRVIYLSSRAMAKVAHW